MRKKLKNYLIPDEENNQSPRIFGLGSFLVLTFVVVVVFASSIIETNIIRNDNQFLAAVLPSVLTTLANQDRSVRGLSELRVNPLLEEAARLKAEDMAAKGYFAHTSPEGLTPWTWFDRVGYQYVHAGENLAVSFSQSESVAKAWMDSPSHRDNILNSNYTEMGIATARGMYKGKETVFVVQMFGTPSTPKPVVTHTPVAVAPTTPPATTTDSAVIPADGAMGVAEIPGQGLVAGADVDDVIVDDSESLVDEVEVLSEADELVSENIATEDTTVEPVVESEIEETTASSARYGFMHWFVENPTLIMRIVYLTIMGLIFISLGVSAYRGVSEQLIHNTIIAVGLMVLMLVLMYIAHRTMIPMLTLW